MLLVDTVEGRVIDDEELKDYYASRQPYGEWLDRNLIQLKDLKIPNQRVPEYTTEERAENCRKHSVILMNHCVKCHPCRWQKTEGERTAAMGIDTPLAVLVRDSISRCLIISNSCLHR